MKSQKVIKINEINYLGRTHNPKVLTLNYCQSANPKVFSFLWDIFPSKFF